MITVEELRYKLSATDTGFRQVMANAIQTVQTYHQRVQEGARVMRNWGLAATGVGSAIFYAMKRIVDSTGQAASSVRDVANQIGVATTSLQRLRFAALRRTASRCSSSTPPCGHLFAGRRRQPEGTRRFCRRLKGSVLRRKRCRPSSTTQRAFPDLC